jgi:hypothetical protein
VRILKFQNSRRITSSSNQQGSIAMKILGKLIVIVSTSMCCAQIFAVVVNGGTTGNSYMQNAPATNPANNAANSNNQPQQTQNGMAPAGTPTPGVQPDASTNPGVQPDPASNPGLQPAS